jgi:hypothetical protein
MTRVPLEATTAHDARREIARRWPDRDVCYWGYNSAGQCVIGSLVEVGQSLADQAKNPASLARFEAEIS